MNSVIRFKDTPWRIAIALTTIRFTTWNGESDVTLLSGRTIRLKFEMKNALLYAFQAIGSGPSSKVAGVAITEEGNSDLIQEIEVGPEIVITNGGRRITMHAANQKCIRCGGIIAEFDPARVFKTPPGKTEKIHFHLNCVGKVTIRKRAGAGPTR